MALTEKSEWVIERAATLLNYNRAYLATQNFSDILIQESILDPKLKAVPTPRELF